MPGIIVGFVVGKGFLADLITDEECEDVVRGQPEPLPTHVYMRASDNSWSVEAVFPRVRALPPGGYRSDHMVREYWLDLPRLAYERVQTYARLELGEKYNLVGLLACWLYIERRWTWTGRYIPWKFCSQLVTQLLRVGDIDACPGVYDDDVTPASLEAWLSISPQARRYFSLSGYE